MNRMPTLFLIAAMTGGFASAAVAANEPSTATPRPATKTSPSSPSRQSAGSLRGIVINVDATPAAAPVAPAAVAARKPKPLLSRRTAAASGPQGQVYSTDSSLRSPGGQVTQSNPAH